MPVLIVFPSCVQFGMFETMTSAFIDEFPHLLRNKKLLFTGFMCFIEFVLGIPCVFQVNMLVCFLVELRSLDLILEFV